MIVITGTSGSLGNHIAELLLTQEQTQNIRLTSRTVEKLEKYKQAGFDTALFDFDNQASMASALEGCKTLLLISGTASVGKRLLQQRAAVEAAKQAGVERIIYTSYANPGVNSYFSFAEIHADTEQQIINSGLRYSILRNPMYMENIAGPIQAAANSGVLAAPGQNAERTYLTKKNIAEITVNVLLNNDEANTVYELTGSEVVTLNTIAATASKVLDKQISVTDLPISAFVDKLVSLKLPPFLVTSLAGLAQAIKSEEYKAVNTQAEKLLGKAPTTIEAFIKSIT